MALTSAHIFGLLLRLLPTPASEAEVERYYTIALAARDVVETASEWPGTRDELLASLLMIVRKESNGSERVHSGEVRGPFREVCLTQIHPTVERFVVRLGYEYEGLTGTSLEATRACLHVAVRLLSTARSRCLRQQYRTYWAEAMASHYGTGSKCWAAKSRMERGRLVRTILGWIRSEKMFPIEARRPST